MYNIAQLFKYKVQHEKINRFKFTHLKPTLVIEAQAQAYKNLKANITFWIWQKIQMYQKL